MNEEELDNVYGDAPIVDTTLIDTYDPNIPVLDQEAYDALFEIPSDEPTANTTEVIDPLDQIGKPVKPSKGVIDLEGIVEDFKSLGVLDDDIIKEFVPDGTVLTQDIIAKAVKELPNRVVNKLLHEANDKSEGLVAFITEGGNVQEWINTYMESRTLLEEHDIEQSDDVAIAVNRAVFKSMGLSDETINTKIARLQSLGTLKDEAFENYEVYSKLKSTAISNLNNRQSQTAKQSQENYEQSQRDIKEYIKNLNDVNGIVFDKKAKAQLEEDIFNNGRLSKRLNGPDANKLFVQIAALEKLGLLDGDYTKFSIVPTIKGSGTSTKSESYDFTKRFNKR